MPSAPSTSYGAILLVRHGKPALSRNVRLSARGYRRWWDDAYEIGGLMIDEAAPADVREFAEGAAAILTSTRRRAIESAALVRPGYTPAQDPDLIEAPLPTPPLPESFRVGPRIWGFISRFIWWYFGYSAGQESRREAEVRADRVAEKLIGLSQAGDVMVVAHGFFNIMIGRALKKRGWRQIGREGFLHWNARRFEFRR
jgi:broad specificity phosphatase PhoE